MLKFTIKDLLISTLLVALGLGMESYWFNNRTALPDWLDFFLYFFGFGIAGIGFAFPLKRWNWIALGFIAGLLIAFVIPFVLLYLGPHAWPGICGPQNERN
jgi:hypothetical protein